MGVYLPNMEMPKDGEMLCVNIYPDGKVCINLDLECKQIATAVPVQKHGRLIDADALAVHKFVDAEHDISIADGGGCYRRGWNDAIEAIMENAETIIGAE